MFAGAGIKILPGIASDHSPLLISLSESLIDKREHGYLKIYDSSFQHHETQLVRSGAGSQAKTFSKQLHCKF